MTVLDLLKTYDFDSVLPHLDHLFVVNDLHGTKKKIVNLAQVSKYICIFAYNNLKQ